MLLILQYDGGAFAGWQRQKADRTVQAELEGALGRLTGGDAPVVGAGRTDAGVHALGQVASARVPERWQPAGLVRALNALLPAGYFSSIDSILPFTMPKPLVLPKPMGTKPCSKSRKT